MGSCDTYVLAEKLKREVDSDAMLTGFLVTSVPCELVEMVGFYSRYHKQQYINLTLVSQQY